MAELTPWKRDFYGKVHLGEIGREAGPIATQTDQP
jgi:hypothetical protein